MKELVKNESLNGNSLSIKTMCSALEINRSTIYYMKKSKGEKDLLIRESIHSIVEEFPTYGYRRIKSDLLREYGILIGKTKLLGIMREEGLIVKRRKKYKIRTTDSNHSFPIYPNLLTDLEITKPDQAWVSDITYIFFRNGVGYLASTLDAYSRRCIGHAFEPHMRQELTMDALLMAIQTRNLKPSKEAIGLIHHSDRGSQYAAEGFRNILKQYGITGSMSSKGNCYDNAMAESFNKTIKYDEVYLNDYQDYEDALNHLDHFIDEVYNKKRLHSSIGYMPPEEFENLYALHTVR